MNDVTRNCTGCGKPYPQSELLSMPSGRGAYRKEKHYCLGCREGEFKKRLLKTAKTNFNNLQRPRHSRPGTPFKW